MHIEKIELIGFKSFAEKTTFSLHPGITCIVGPNGSGKSNIVDSFRWVLGEQSAKSLRGEKMEEVIFNGSAAKKPRGMSEVNLILLFDSPEQGNGGSRTPTTISRRLYRSGESEYLINRSSCRLKDIRDLILDTGLEIRSYAILEQGRISEILNAKPQDRRFLIEEVAGVMKYKVRRAEAQSKLESSRLNLQRVSDIVNEVRRQINALDRQVKKAERYKRLSAEAREVELRIAKQEFLALRESLASIRASHAAAREEEAVVRTDLDTIENTRETRQIALLEHEKTAETLVAELQGVERKIADAERAAAVAAAEANHLRENRIRLETQEGDLTGRIAEAVQKQAELGAAEEGFSTGIERLRIEISEQQEAIRSLEEELSEREGGIEAKRREVFRTAEELSHARNEIGRLQTSIENLERKGAAATREIEATNSQLTLVEEEIRRIDGSIVSRQNDLRVITEQRERLSTEIAEHQARLEDVRARLARAREELASASSRLESLREIMREEFSKEVLTEAERLHILATVAELIEVDESFEKAVENALAGKINGFILPNTGDIENAAALLRGRSISRTVFIPRETPAPSGSSGVAVPDDGILGRAAEFIRVPPGREGFAPVIRALLEGIYIVRDLSAAFQLLRAGLPATFVTLDGEIVEPSGAVTVGEGRGILKRKRETRELETLTETRQEEINTLEGLISRHEASLADRQQALRDVDSAAVEAEKEISLLRHTVDTQRSEQERISRKLSYLHIEKGEVGRERESFLATAAEKEAEAERISGRKAAAEEAIGRIQEEIAASRERYETERTSITDLRLSLGSLRERLEAVKKEIDQAGTAVSDLTEARGRVHAEAAGTASRILQIEADISRAEEVLKGLVVQADGLRQVIAGHREVIRTGTEEITAIGQQAKALRQRLDSLTGRIAEIEVSLAEHRLKLGTLGDGVRQTYGIEIETIETAPAEPEDEARLAELREKIRELGPVNLGTIEEYEELKGRYDFLTKQQDDLNRSIAELEEAITKINSTTRKKLRDAYDQLSVKFAEVFTYLFGGGKAELVLTDEQNILETGIDIIAQPPGKKLQNINLLSGGEKALTALALLFASFLIKPSPLCILDEVDAPLDEANVGRFGRMLRELSDRIQFIVVTHNRITMEAADYIYGITMEEPGVSKVISMQMVDSAGA